MLHVSGLHGTKGFVAMVLASPLGLSSSTAAVLSCACDMLGPAIKIRGLVTASEKGKREWRKERGDGKGCKNGKRWSVVERIEGRTKGICHTWVGSGRPEAKVTGNLQKQSQLRASGRLRTVDVRDKVRGKLSGKGYRSQTIWRDGWAALRFEATLPRLSSLSRRYHGFSDAVDIGSPSSRSTGPAPSESEAKAEVGIVTEPGLGPDSPWGRTRRSLRKPRSCGN